MNSDILSLYAMVISIIALGTQVVFGVLSTKRAIKETDRQIGETKKQEKLHIIAADETYKGEVRAWGRGVVRAMALAQQLCKVDPTKFVTSDYDLNCAQTVAHLRGYLDKAKWLFPKLAIPSSEGHDWNAPHKKRLSALETIMHAYHTLETVKSDDPQQRARCVASIRKLRKRFVIEMKRAVDPAVRGHDIQRFMEEVEDELVEEKVQAKEQPAPSEPAAIISPSESAALRK